MENKIIHNKIYYNIPFPILILVIEIVMGGIGRLFNLPIRHIVFALVSILTIKFLYSKNIKIDKDAKTFGIGMFIYVFVWIIIGIVRGNGLKMAVGDTTNFFAILYTYILIVFIDNDDSMLHKVIDLFTNLTVILSAVTLLVFVWSYIAQSLGVHSVLIIDTIESKLNYGVISGWLYNDKFARVYLPNGIYMQIALAILIQKLILCLSEKSIDLTSKDIKILFIKILIIIMGILASGTRGYWLGAFIVVMLTIFTLEDHNRSKYIKIVGIMCIVGIIFILLLPIKNQILGRIASIFDFNEDVSNNIRQIQVKHMMKQFVQNPIFGSGFGKEIIAYTNETGRGGLDFEVYYMELMYKTGIVGLSIFLYIISKYIIIKPYKMLSMNIKSKDKALLNGWLVGTISVLFISITNPYISGNYGLFILDMMVVIFVVLKSKYRRNVI